jgi:hypothetical protein
MARQFFDNRIGFVPNGDANSADPENRLWASARRVFGTPGPEALVYALGRSIRLSSWRQNPNRHQKRTRPDDRS